MALIKLLWDMLLICILLISIIFVCIGGLWVLRIEIKEVFDEDYVKRIKEWIQK